MSLFGITLDQFAVGKDSTTSATMTIQCICVLLSLFLISVQIYRFIQKRNGLKSNWKLATLMSTQFIMMCLATLYMIIHLWNYVMLYVTTNPLECHAWFGFIMSSLGLSRIFLMTFLMLRSTFAFEGTFCELSIKITGIFIAFNAIGNLILFPLIVYGSEPVSPVPGKGFCFRTLGHLAISASTAFHLYNCLLSIIALVIFYWKSRSVRKMVETLLKEEKFDSRMIAIDEQFRKHVKLGMITVAGTIIIFFVQDLFSVLIGIGFAFDQTVNNVLTFVMFKDNKFVYQWMLCKSCESNQQHNIENLRTSLQNIPRSDIPKTETKSKVPTQTEIVIR